MKKRNLKIACLMIAIMMVFSTTSMVLATEEIIVDRPEKGNIYACCDEAISIEPENGSLLRWNPICAATGHDWVWTGETGTVTFHKTSYNDPYCYRTSWWVYACSRPLCSNSKHDNITNTRLYCH